MVKNYISENLQYLVDRERTSKDDFGVKFDLKRGIVSQYIRKVSIPKLETIQQICEFYNLTLDQFVNTNMSEEIYKAKEIENQSFNEPPEGYGYVSLKYVELLENAISDKDKIIKELEEKINPDKRKQA